MPTHYTGTAEETLALNTFIRLNRCAESLNHNLEAVMKQGNLSGSQFGVLEVLLHIGPLAQGEISKRLLKSSANLTQVLDNLEERGLITRTRPATDRRKLIIDLTPAGRELIMERMPVQVQAIVQALSALTPEEQATLGTLCRKLGLQNPR